MQLKADDVRAMLAAKEPVDAVDKAKKLERCRDCYNNFYNGNGAKECWSLESAQPQVVHVVPTWQEWPEKHMKPINRLSCWQPNRGTSVMKREPAK